MAFFIPAIIAVANAIGQRKAQSKKEDNAAKTASTVKADEVESLLKSNVASWQATPDAFKTVELQQAYVDKFNTLWYTFHDAMAQLGQRGQNAINERQRGGKNSWGPDWFQLYLDPIANATVVDELTGATYKTTIDTATNLIKAEQVNGMPVNLNANPNPNTGGAIPGGSIPVDVINLGTGDLTTPLILAGAALVAYSILSKK